MPTPPSMTTQKGDFMKKFRKAKGSASSGTTQGKLMLPSCRQYSDAESTLSLCRAVNDDDEDNEKASCFKARVREMISHLDQPTAYTKLHMISSSPSHIPKCLGCVGTIYLLSWTIWSISPLLSMPFRLVNLRGRLCCVSRSYQISGRISQLWCLTFQQKKPSTNCTRSYDTRRNIAICRVCLRIHWRRLCAVCCKTFVNIIAKRWCIFKLVMYVEK